LGGEQIELLGEVVPRLSRVGVVWDSGVGEVPPSLLQRRIR
jgi:hypothetical protein